MHFVKLAFKPPYDGATGYIPMFVPSTGFAFSIAVYGKADASIERSLVNAVHTVGDGDAFKAVASGEC